MFLILEDHFLAIKSENVIVNKGVNPDKCHETKVALIRKFVEEIKNN